MKLVKPSVEELIQGPGIIGMYEQIELAGRICYKSEPVYEYRLGDAILTEEEVSGLDRDLFSRRSTTAEAFVARMMDSGHGAMLEHGNVYLTVHESDWIPEKLSAYIVNPYTKVEFHDEYIFISTNLRVLFENDWLDDLIHFVEPTELHHSRLSYKIITDRGVSHELVRHRVFSFAMESTRYCNYSKDKFDNQLTYIIPPQLYNLANFEDYLKIANEDHHVLYKIGHDSQESNENRALASFLFDLKNAENGYHFQTSMGWKAQESRAILPTAIKTELIMTGFAEDWIGGSEPVVHGFFPLRQAKSAHPQAQEIANMIAEIF